MLATMAGGKQLAQKERASFYSDKFDALAVVLEYGSQIEQLQNRMTGIEDRMTGIDTNLTTILTLLRQQQQ
jgi:hypothetical protein